MTYKKALEPSSPSKSKNSLVKPSPKLQIYDSGLLRVVSFDPVYTANNIISEIKHFLHVFSNKVPTLSSLVKWPYLYYFK